METITVLGNEPTAHVVEQAKTAVYDINTETDL
jgi:hypothetical protein